MVDKLLKELGDRLGHRFSDWKLLEEALRHPSFSHENPQAGPHNQRLEFLGDAVVGLVVADHLVRSFPGAREGELTRYRAALVSERSLADAARGVDLGEAIVLGRGEESQGGRDRQSVLADGLEAIVGAAFLDGGLDAARAVVGTILGERLETVAAGETVDHKSLLQEQVQSAAFGALEYAVVGEEGPDHDKRFEVEVRLDDRLVGRGSGTSKKMAEQAAAEDALGRLRGGDDP